MHKNYFDIVMAHIEENVTKPTEEIKREIPKLIVRHGRAFNEHFSMLTGYTLDYYIKQRRLHYAARELVTSKQKSICDIALEYQFSDQSAFSRAIKDKYSVTPNEIRKEGLWFEEDRFLLEDFAGQKSETQVAKILRHMEIYDYIPAEDVELMLEIERLNDEYHFDIDTCYQIADLAEQLGVPIGFFGERCFLAVADIRSDPNYISSDIPPEVEFAVNLGIDSEEELDAMCNHFKCEYYELDETKVYLYRKLNKQQN